MTAPYVHIVIEGPAEQVRGFLLGVSAVTETGPVVFADEAGLREAGLARRFAELLHLAPEESEALVPESLLDDLKKAIDRDEEFDITLKKARKIKFARFSFEFEVFNMEEAEAIRNILETEHPGIELRNYNTDEDVRPEAKGTEIFTPAHEYTFSGSGEVIGTVAATCFIHEALASHEQATVEPIDLELE